MEVNLKNFAKDTYVLKHIEKILSNETVTRGLVRKLSKIIKEREEIEVDLELSGESIIELDMPRLEAIEEKNKMTSFIINNNEF